jgi:hypothetical protein
MTTPTTKHDDATLAAEPAESDDAATTTQATTATLGERIPVRCFQSEPSVPRA